MNDLPAFQAAYDAVVAAAAAVAAAVVVAAAAAAAAVTYSSYSAVESVAASAAAAEESVEEPGPQTLKYTARISWPSSNGKTNKQTSPKKLSRESWHDTSQTHICRVRQYKYFHAVIWQNTTVT